MNTSEQERESSVELRPLPTGWSWTGLGELGLVRLGKTPRKSDYRDFGNHKIVKFRDVDEHGRIDWHNPVKGFVDSSPEVLNTLKDIRQGDVLVTASAHMSEHIGKKVGIVANIPGQFEGAYVVGEILQVRTRENVEPKWVLYYLRSTDGYKAIQRRVHGVHLISSRAQNIEVPIAPLDQQIRVVSEIEKQFSRLDAAVANLKHVKANIKRYKAAVLKAAVEGGLVETEAELARREGRSYETGAQLLQRILETRRNQWQGKGKYKEPTAPDTSDLPELPEGWVWATVDQALMSLRNGLSKKPDDSEPGIPILRISAVRPLKLDTNDSRFYRQQANESIDDYKLEDGDVLFVRYNGTKELVGACAQVNAVSGKLLYPDKLIRGRVVCKQQVLPSYLAIAANVGKSRQHVEELIKTTAGQQGIAGGEIKQMPLPLPPVAEQHRIVAEVDRHLSLANEAEVQVNANLQRAERLRQSILQRAFTTPCVDETSTAAQ